jgi:hypothetical protein
MLEALTMARSCVQDVPVCNDTLGFDAGPLIVILFTAILIGLLITVILGVRRRRQLLESYQDPAAEREDPPAGE